MNTERPAFPPIRMSLVLLGALALQPAFADHAASANVVHAKVALADLDLNSPVGRAAARDRIASAAKKLCAQFDDDRKVDHVVTRGDCVHEAMAAGFAQLTAQSSAAPLNARSTDSR
jgi:UrcA family protein